MRLPRMKAIAGFFLAAVLSAPAWSSDTSANSAHQELSIMWKAKRQLAPRPWTRSR